METLDIILKLWQLAQATYQPGSSHIKVGF